MAWSCLGSPLLKFLPGDEWGFQPNNLPFSNSALTEETLKDKRISVGSLAATRYCPKARSLIAQMIENSQPEGTAVTGYTYVRYMTMLAEDTVQLHQDQQIVSTHQVGNCQYPVGMLLPGKITSGLLLCQNASAKLEFHLLVQGKETKDTLPFPDFVEAADINKLTIKAAGNNSLFFVYAVPKAEFKDAKINNFKVVFVDARLSAEHKVVATVLDLSQPSYGLAVSSWDNLFFLDSSHDGYLRNEDPKRLDFFIGCKGGINNTGIHTSHCTRIMDLTSKEPAFRCRSVDSRVPASGQETSLLGLSFTGSQLVQVWIAYAEYTKDSMKTVTSVKNWNYETVYGDNTSKYPTSLTALNETQGIGFFAFENGLPYRILPLGNGVAGYYQDSALKYIQVKPLDEKDSFFFVYDPEVKEVMRSQYTTSEYTTISKGCFNNYGISSGHVFSIQARDFAQTSGLTLKYVKYQDYGKDIGLKQQTCTYEFIVNEEDAKLGISAPNNRLYQGVTPGQGTSLLLDSSLLTGLYKLPFTYSGSKFVPSTIQQLRYFIKGENKALVEVKSRVLGKRNFFLDLDSRDMYYCDTDLSSDLVITCTLAFNLKGVTFGKIMNHSMFLDAAVVVVHEINKIYSLSAVDIKTGDVWTESIDLSQQGSTLYTAVLDPYNCSYLYFAYLKNDQVKIEQRERKTGKVVINDISSRMQNFVPLSFSLSILDGFWTAYTFQTKLGIYQWKQRLFNGNTDYLPISLTKIPNFKTICSMGRDDSTSAKAHFVGLSGDQVYVFEESNAVKVDLKGSIPVDWMHCGMSGLFFLKRGTYLEEYDFRDGLLTLNKTLTNRFRVKKVYEVPFDYTLVYSTHNWYLLRSLSSASKPQGETVLYELNRKASQVFVVPVDELALTSEVRVKLTPQVTVASGNELEVQISLESDVPAPEKFEVKCKPSKYEDNIRSVIHQVEEGCNISGHVLSMTINDKNSTLLSTPKLRNPQKFSNPDADWIINFDYQSGYFVILARDTKQRKKRLYFYDDKRTLLNSTVVSLSGSAHDISHLKLSKVEGNLLVVSLVERQETSYLGTITFTIFDLKNKRFVTSLNPKRGIGIPRYDTMYGLVYKEKYSIVYHSEISHKLYIDSLNNKTGNHLLSIDSVSAFDVVNSYGNLYVVTALVGQKELRIDILNQELMTVKSLETDFKEMHYYDKVKCYSKDSSSLECLFAGRRVKVVKFSLTDKSAKVAGTPEEYHAYKNLLAEQVDFTEDHMIIAGRRFTDQVEDNTFDHSGIFVYNRVKKAGGSKYVRQLVSKDEIFEMVRSNNYRVALSGRNIAIHGGFNDYVKLFDIEQYTIEGKPMSKAEMERVGVEVVSASGKVQVPLSAFIYKYDPSNDTTPQADQNTHSYKVLFIVLALVVFVLLGYLVNRYWNQYHKTTEAPDNLESLSKDGDYSMTNNDVSGYEDNSTK